MPHKPDSPTPRRYKPIGGTPIDLSRPENHAEWRARWIMDPAFHGLPYRPVDSADRSPANRTELQNIHTLFRKTFVAAGAPIASARLYITADDVYKLYVNGRFVGIGPAQSYPFAHFYNGWDVTGLLRPGEPNCLAVHVYYQGLFNLAYTSADNLQGLLAQLEMAYSDGQHETIVSDGSWRYQRSEAFVGERAYGYETQLTEDIDLRLWEPGWNLVDFDDSGWAPAKESDEPIPSPYTLVLQPTPPLDFWEVAPERVVKKGDGRFFIDFGTELVGTTAFTVTGPAGHVVEIRHGEELSAPDEVRCPMRAGCDYQEYCTLSGRPDERLEFFDYKGFRYVEVLNWPGELTAENVRVLARHYPFDDDACSFASSDDLLNGIWTLCANGVKQGTQDTYLDCPTREKGGFLGDGFVTGQSHLLLTGDERMLKKFLQDFARSARFRPGIMSTAPGYVAGVLADYSMLWPPLVEEYYLWTADREFVERMQPVLDGMLEYFEGFENADGLLQGVESILVDWPGNLRDDYDYDLAKQTICTQLNHFYYGCLRASARLCSIVGRVETAGRLDARAERLAAACVTQLMDAKSGTFFDAPGSEHFALHANVLPLTYGMLSPEQYGPLVEHIRAKRLSCGVYFAFFVLKGLYKVGRADLAYDLMTCRDERSWHTMLQAGATTCMEAWGPEQKWNTSWCHPWSSSPTHMICCELMGLGPAAPGWEAIRFAPQPPLALDRAELFITTPRGVVGAAFEQKGPRITYRLSVPDGASLQCMFAGVVRQIIVDDKECLGDERTDGFGVTRVCVPGMLPPGEHVIQMARKGDRDGRNPVL